MSASGRKRTCKAWWQLSARSGQTQEKGIDARNMHRARQAPCFGNMEKKNGRDCPCRLHSFAASPQRGGGSGMLTLSMPWITPFLAMMSGRVICAPSMLS